MNVDASRRKSLGEMWEEIPVLFGRKYTDVSFFNAVYHFRSGMRSANNSGDHTMYKTLRKKILGSYTRHPKSGLKRIIKIIRER